MNISEKIQILRRDREWSQDELAEKLEVSRQSVSKWESGKALPDSEKILALAKLFDVSTDFLLRDEQEPLFADDGQDPVDEDLKGDLAANCVPDITEKKKHRLSSKKIIAIVVAVCIVIAAITPLFFGGYSAFLARISEDPVQYPYVLVHGLGGWGPESQIDQTSPYWGSSTGNLAEYLNSEGYSVSVASVGPFSSTWDRTCELYAELTGTKVDYGEAHSKAHGHDRYGREYTSENALVQNWGGKTKRGQHIKINVIGHSFGGETVRLLASLMAYGDEAEKEATGKETSELFTGGKADWINSVTTLCSPHNGSTLFYVVDQGKLVNTVLGLVYAASGIASTAQIGDFYDFRLEQFGMSGASTESQAAQIINTVFSEGTDNAAYDLSPDGAQELNKKIKLVDNVYYFSYSYLTTQKSSLTGNQVPISSTLPVLFIPATLMGRYSTNTKTDFPIDETWLPNDGLVNVVSARYPIGDEYREFDAENIEKGKWNVMPTLQGDHGTVIGMNVGAEETHNFYDTLFKMIDSQPRDKKYYIF